MSTPQFHTDPLSSKHRFLTSTTPFQHPKSLSSTSKSSTHPSVPQQKPLSSTPLSSTSESPQFNTKTPSFPHQKLLSSTHPSIPHQKPLSSTPFLSKWCLELREGGTDGFLLWNWGVCWTEGVFGVELRDFESWIAVALLFWTFVFNRWTLRILKIIMTKNFPIWLMKRENRTHNSWQ